MSLFKLFCFSSKHRSSFKALIIVSYCITVSVPLCTSPAFPRGPAAITCSLSRATRLPCTSQAAAISWSLRALSATFRATQLPCSSHAAAISWLVRALSATSRATWLPSSSLPAAILQSSDSPLTSWSASVVAPQLPAVTPTLASRSSESLSMPLWEQLLLFFSFPLREQETLPSAVRSTVTTMLDPVAFLLLLKRVFTTRLNGLIAFFPIEQGKTAKNKEKIPTKTNPQTQPGLGESHNSTEHSEHLHSVATTMSKWPLGRGCGCGIAGIVGRDGAYSSSGIIASGKGLGLWDSRYSRERILLKDI
ncbi:hypothetical protein XENTR_v10022706 [Xenopus tropicalis]|nr:hypothetical protein XENTR_v10022706 [Xenopus tropicalis]